MLKVLCICFDSTIWINLNKNLANDFFWLCSDSLYVFVPSDNLLSKKFFWSLKKLTLLFRNVFSTCWFKSAFSLVALLKICSLRNWLASPVFRHLSNSLRCLRETIKSNMSLLFFSFVASIPKAVLNSLDRFK